MNETSDEANMATRKAFLSADDFLRGILAALRVTGHKQIIAAQRNFHRAFDRILKKLDAPEFTDAIMVNTSDIDFDPLYGLSEWLDCAFLRARRDFLIRFLSSFRVNLIIEINLGEDGGKEMLSEFGSREALLKLATLLHVEMAAS